VLAALADTRIKATFFMVGEQVAANPKLAQAVKAAGHSIGSHTMTHARGKGMPKLTQAEREAEVYDCDNVMRESLGVARLPLFRLPYGAGLNDPTINALIGDRHDFNVYWSIDTNDWKNHGTQWIVDQVLESGARLEGAIVLCHDHSKGIAPAVRTIVTTLKARGYKFVTLDQMLSRRLTRAAPVPAVQG
jgi:peptidoglycan/xylan/chitin deacetylase (PgdA/CDA1 family)